MFVPAKSARVLAATMFAGAFAAVTLSGSDLAAADTAKTVKVSYRNGSKVPIQVFLYDEVGKVTVVKYNEVTPGGSGSAQVAVKYDGNVDLTYRVLVKNAKGVFDGEQHCRPVKTSADTASAATELAYEKLSKC